MTCHFADIDDAKKKNRNAGMDTSKICTSHHRLPLHATGKRVSQRRKFEEAVKPSGRRHTSNTIPWDIELGRDGEGQVSMILHNVRHTQRLSSPELAPPLHGAPG